MQRLASAHKNPGAGVLPPELTVHGCGQANDARLLACAINDRPSRFIVTESPLNNFAGRERRSRAPRP